MAKQLRNGIKDALKSAGYKDMNEVRCTPVDTLKRKIGADLTNEVVEYFQDTDGTMEWDYARITLAGDE